MKQRKIYYRRKGGKIVAEGKMNNKTIFLFKIPKTEEVLKSPFFSQEKRAKIMEKISRLDYKTEKVKKEPQEVRIIEIMSSSENGDEEDDFSVDDEINDLVGKV